MTVTKMSVCARRLVFFRGFFRQNWESTCHFFVLQEEVEKLQLRVQRYRYEVGDSIPEAVCTCLILHRSAPFKLHNTKLPTPRNICAHFHLQYTTASHIFSNIFNSLDEFIDECVFCERACACTLYASSAHTTKTKKKKVLSTYGAQANSSEEMLTSR